MRKIANLLPILFVVACQKEDPRIAEILETVQRSDKRLEALEKRPAAGPATPPPRRGPDPNTVYYIPVNDTDVMEGAKHAKVTIIEGFDYACPFCAQSRTGVQEALAKHKDDVRVVSKQFVVHPQVATLPALAVCAANKQGKGKELEHEIWARAWKQDEPTSRPKFDATQLSQENLEKVATEAKLDVAKLKADMDSAACKDMIAREQKELASVGVGGTPAFFINGKPYQGPRTADGFNAAIEEEIKKADSAIKAGTKLEDYYASLMKTAQKSL